MQVVNDAIHGSDLPRGGIATIGNFDGLHRGQRAIVEQVVTRARELGESALAITFEPHPLSVLRPSEAPTLLVTPAQKDQLFEAAGMDALLRVGFTPEFAETSAEDFITRFLYRKLALREIYVGKLIASLVPGYATTIAGFGIYSLIVNVLVGPEVGGWFFPTAQWWVLMLWVVPPFLALTLSLVLRLSARVKSTAAAQQAAGLVTLPMIGIAYSQSTGALFGADKAGLWIGGIAWVVAGIALSRGMRAVSRARLLGVADGI